MRFIEDCRPIMPAEAMAIFLPAILAVGVASAQQPQPPQQQEAPPTCEEQLIGQKFGNGRIVEANGKLQQQVAELENALRLRGIELAKAQAEVVKLNAAREAAEKKSAKP